MKDCFSSPTYGASRDRPHLLRFQDSPNTTWVSCGAPIHLFDLLQSCLPTSRPLLARLSRLIAHGSAGRLCHLAAFSTIRDQTQVVILGLLELDLQDLFYLPRRFCISIRSSIWAMAEKYTPKVLVIMVGLFL